MPIDVQNTSVDTVVSTTINNTREQFNPLEIKSFPDNLYFELATISGLVLDLDIITDLGGFDPTAQTITATKGIELPPVFKNITDITGAPGNGRGELLLDAPTSLVFLTPRWDYDQLYQIKTTGWTPKQGHRLEVVVRYTDRTGENGNALHDGYFLYIWDKDASANRSFQNSDPANRLNNLRVPAGAITEAFEDQLGFTFPGEFVYRSSGGVGIDGAVFESLSFFPGQHITLFYNETDDIWEVSMPPANPTEFMVDQMEMNTSAAQLRDPGYNPGTQFPYRLSYGDVKFIDFLDDSTGVGEYRLEFYDPRSGLIQTRFTWGSPGGSGDNTVSLANPQLDGDMVVSGGMTLSLGAAIRSDAFTYGRRNTFRNMSQINLANNEIENIHTTIATIATGEASLSGNPVEVMAIQSEGALANADDLDTIRLIPNASRWASAAQLLVNIRGSEFYVYNANGSGGGIITLTQNGTPAVTATDALLAFHITGAGTTLALNPGEAVKVLACKDSLSSNYYFVPVGSVETWNTY